MSNSERPCQTISRRRFLWLGGLTAAAAAAALTGCQKKGTTEAAMPQPTEVKPTEMPMPDQQATGEFKTAVADVIKKVILQLTADARETQDAQAAEARATREAGQRLLAIDEESEQLAQQASAGDEITFAFPMVTDVWAFQIGGETVHLARLARQLTEAKGNQPAVLRPYATVLQAGCIFDALAEENALGPSIGDGHWQPGARLYDLSGQVYLADTPLTPGRVSVVEAETVTLKPGKEPDDCYKDVVIDFNLIGSLLSRLTNP
ncbi:MAG: hypothetical protein JW991_01425 [Candidatus Pacebacteria bacterium]|nr:hypothetical protein [Candidatus Paceibacterota bacterium]